MPLHGRAALTRHPCVDRSTRGTVRVRRGAVKPSARCARRAGGRGSPGRRSARNRRRARGWPRWRWLPPTPASWRPRSSRPPEAAPLLCTGSTRGDCQRTGARGVIIERLVALERTTRRSSRTRCPCAAGRARRASSRVLDEPMRDLLGDRDVGSIGKPRGASGISDASATSTFLSELSCVLRRVVQTAPGSRSGPILQVPCGCQ